MNSSPAKKKTQFRERRVSSGLILTERIQEHMSDNFDERWHRLVKSPPPNLNSLARYEATPGLYFTLKPEIEAVKIYDSWSPSDEIKKYKYFDYAFAFARFASVMLGPISFNVYSICMDGYNQYHRNIFQ